MAQPVFLRDENTGAIAGAQMGNLIISGVGRSILHTFCCYSFPKLKHSLSLVIYSNNLQDFHRATCQLRPCHLLQTCLYRLIIIQQRRWYLPFLLHIHLHYSMPPPQRHQQHPAKDQGVAATSFAAHSYAYSRPTLHSRSLLLQCSLRLECRQAATTHLGLPRSTDGVSLSFAYLFILGQWTHQTGSVICSVCTVPIL